MKTASKFGGKVMFKSRQYNTILKRIGQGICIAAGVVLLIFLLRLFFIVSCYVPTDSMKPTIRMGDYLLVNKMIPGLRFKRNGEICRLRGFRQIRRNDILLFNYPYADVYNSIGKERLIFNGNLFYIKRCLALPRDSFYIENAECKVKGYDRILGCLEEQHELFAIPVGKIKQGCYHCFPHDSLEYGWNAKQFGPLYIPGKGDTVSINGKSIKLYKNIITYETNLEIAIRDSIIYLGDEKLHQYTFKKNYYFMVGDHIKDSHDSRIWGFVPEDHMVGKAFFIWKSKDRNQKMRWNRMFKFL